MTTLANAIRQEFERTHPRGKNTLLCDGPCRRRKDRKEFRETPWHGKAAACWDCEGGFNVDRTVRVAYAWELAQEREKLLAYQRYARHLKLRLLVADIPRSAAVLRAHEHPYMDAVDRSMRKWAPVFSEALSKAHTLSTEDYSCPHPSRATSP